VRELLVLKAKVSTMHESSPSAVRPATASPHDGVDQQAACPLCGLNARIEWDRQRHVCDVACVRCLHYTMTMAVGDAILSASREQGDALTTQLTVLSERAAWADLEGTPLHIDADTWTKAASAHETFRSGKSC
jgi:hypothetical protein